jgi:dUTP pyrophosphatase
VTKQEYISKLRDKGRTICEIQRLLQKTIKFKRLHEEATLPTRATEGSAGFDLTAISVEYKGRVTTYGTGVAVQIPARHVGLLFMRSSVSDMDMALANAVGVVDEDYRGEIKLKYRLHELAEYKHTIRTYDIGERIGQLVVVPILTEAIEVDNLDQTDRGYGGFGSTGG